MIDSILQLQKTVKEMEPLIHGMTNPISIHDCANVILAAGGRPIMADHPGEAAEITEKADALMLNLGNPTDARMESMKKSIKAAKECKIPVLLDLVGISCSTMRMKFVEELLETGAVTVLKGNTSEMLTMAGEPSHSIGLDAGSEDALTSENLENRIAIFQRLATSTNAVLLISGREDLIVSTECAYLVENGHPMLSKITGTGCMQGVLAATYLATGQEWSIIAAIAAAVTMGITGELAAADCPGTGTFQIRLLDALYQMNEEILKKYAKIRKL